MENRNKTVEDMVDYVMNKTMKTDQASRHPIRILSSFFLSVMASNMRVKVSSQVFGDVPVGLYAFNLGDSGTAKNFSVNLLEEMTLHFKQNFIHNILTDWIEYVLEKKAEKFGKSANIDDPELALEKLKSEFSSLGKYAYTFDSGTLAGVKQMRLKLAIGEFGSLSYIIDELAKNITSSTEMLGLFLELFDMGKTREKIIKNTKEQQRILSSDNGVPANLLAFGTGATLFDSGVNEKSFVDLLEEGYGRRAFFSNMIKEIDGERSGEGLYNSIMGTTNTTSYNKLRERFEKLADITLMGFKVVLDKERTIELLNYKIKNEKLASELPSNNTVRIAEYTHRHFKVMKLAGIYAFVDGYTHVTSDHIKQAIALAEESSEHLKKMLARDKPHVILLNHIVERGTTVTIAELTEELKFFPRTKSGREDIFSLARAHGYRNCITLREEQQEGVILYSAEKIEPTDLSEVIVSYSNDIGSGFINQKIKFSDLPKLMKQDDYYWMNHFLDTEIAGDATSEIAHEDSDPEDNDMLEDDTL